MTGMRAPPFCRSVVARATLINTPPSYPWLEANLTVSENDDHAQARTDQRRIPSKAAPFSSEIDMAHPRAAYPPCKITLWVGEDDWEWLKARSGPLGASRIVRDLIIEHRRKIEDLEAPRWAEE